MSYLNRDCIVKPFRVRPGVNTISENVQQVLHAECNYDDQIFVWCIVRGGSASVDTKLWVIQDHEPIPTFETQTDLVHQCSTTNAYGVALHVFEEMDWVTTEQLRERYGREPDPDREPPEVEYRTLRPRNEP